MPRDYDVGTLIWVEQHYPGWRIRVGGPRFVGERIGAQPATIEAESLRELAARIEAREVAETEPDDARPPG